MGFVWCLVAAAGFGLAPLFAKQAYAGGLSVTTMLTARFALAALLLWAIVAIRRRPVRMPARTLALCVGLGAVGYALQGAAYFGAVSMIDASLAALLLYTYPALTLILGVVLRRARADRRRVLALAVSGGGLIMLLGAGFDGGLGVLLALTAAGTYAVYLTVSETLPADLDVFALTAIVCTSAAVSLGVGGAVTGGLHAPGAVSAWGWVAVIAVIGTVLPIAAMFAGVRLIGASTAAILCGLEPAITVVSTALVFGERLTAAQLAGGAAILAAVVILQLPARSASISQRNAGTLGVNGSQPLIVPSSAQ
ncbi:DMT family transporter [Catenuloplanes indicus]|uniref:Drug/metabolite transporter (DMT)-like permease n=1 Tax=Catenuloplanes indicus TaxID=137267 RepID=A0AAE4AWY8_9ACTN|nr:DMT family transporter [Catenuloplanes indicus]MDQ0363648.1 drug/metabolite transporter (DMT)-like permease [Catenuloplanes indicus]